jgi:O-acetyl-ADP-ribose deacetylase (regulator of RNase III)
MPLTIIQNDITKMSVDAIVNAANTALRMGGGVCGAIFKAAGANKLQAACNEAAPIRTGEAVITPGFALPAKYVIHTAGPVYRGGRHDEENQLRSCYVRSLNLAKENACASIAFPLISSGIYGYPVGEAISVAITAIREWLPENDMDISLVIFDQATFALARKIADGIRCERCVQKKAARRF